jgi:hypothetical protein
MTERLPWSKFSWNAWETDPGLALCSMAAQGFWMRLLCIAAKEDGYVLVNGAPPSHADLAYLMRTSVQDVDSWIADLEGNGVFSRTGRNVIYCRRIVKESKGVVEARENGKRGGNPKLMGGYNQPGFVYLMGTRSDGAYKIGVSVNPDNRVKKIRAQYPSDPIRVLDRTLVQDMGESEARVHQTFASKKDGEWFYLDDLDLCKLRDIFKTLQGSGKGVDFGPSKADKEERREERDSARKRATRIDPDWHPSEIDRAYAAKLGFDESAILRIAEKFKNYWLAQPGKNAAKLDWQATWRNWVISEAERNPPTGLFAPRRPEVF